MDLNELESFTSFVSKVDPTVKNLIIDLLSSGLSDRFRKIPTAL